MVQDNLVVIPALLACIYCGRNMGNCIQTSQRFMKISKKEQRRRLGLSLVWLRECGKSRVVASTTTFPTYNIKSRLRAASTSFWNTASGFAAAVPGICALCADRGSQKTRRSFSGKYHYSNICIANFAMVCNKASILKQSK